jgi:hypothetical protein
MSLHCRHAVAIADAPSIAVVFVAVALLLRFPLPLSLLPLPLLPFHCHCVPLTLPLHQPSQLLLLPSLLLSRLPLPLPLLPLCCHCTFHCCCRCRRVVIAAVTTVAVVVVDTTVTGALAVATAVLFAIAVHPPALTSTINCTLTLLPVVVAVQLPMLDCHPPPTFATSVASWLLFVYPSCRWGCLWPSSAPPIQPTCPTPPCHHSKNALPGLPSCGHRGGYPCACKRPVQAISFARCMYIWGDALGGWEGMHALVWRDFYCVGHGSGVVLL